MKKFLFFSFSICCIHAMQAFLPMSKYQESAKKAEFYAQKSNKHIEYEVDASASTGSQQAKHSSDRSANRFIEANFRYFQPSSCILQEIYGKNWIDYQVKFSASLMPRKDFWRGLHAWFAINYAGKSGRSINGGEKTKIQLVPLSFGLRFVGDLGIANGCTQYYFGTGLKYYFMEINNTSQFVEPCISRSSLGGVAEAGLYFLVGEHIAFNLMLDYSFIRFSCPKKSCIENVQRFPLKASGIAVGGGIGLRF